MKVFNKATFIVLLAFVIIVFGVIFKKTIQSLNQPTLRGKEGNMKLQSVFEHNTNIPSKYTCDGEDLAPELTISEVPADTKELALIVDDPDAPMGTWVHWLVYNIPANTTTLDAKNLPQGSKQGFTDFRRVGWGGPCPPNGQHRYFFKLYAIDTNISLAEGATKSQLENAIKNHIIEKAELIGLYKRK